MREMNPFAGKYAYRTVSADSLSSSPYVSSTSSQQFRTSFRTRAGSPARRRLAIGSFRAPRRPHAVRGWLVMFAHRRSCRERRSVRCRTQRPGASHLVYTALSVPKRSHSPLQNQLLASLPSDVLERLEPSLEPVSMGLGDALYESGIHLSHVYFPTTSIVSLLYVMENGSSAEIAIVGNEGVVGVSLFMGGETTP